MRVTPTNARQIIRAHYGESFKFRITTGCTIGVRPIYETQIGLPTLVWSRVVRGNDSIVRIGRLLPGLTIDWFWENEKPLTAT